MKFKIEFMVETELNEPLPSYLSIYELHRIITDEANFEITAIKKRGGDSIAIEWNVDDVLEIRPDLSEEQAAMVLMECERHHDADVGINWDSLISWTQLLYPITDDGKDDET